MLHRNPTPSLFCLMHVFLLELNPAATLDRLRRMLVGSAVTWQLLQHSPLLHFEPCVNVHLLQQAPPSLAHSWNTETPLLDIQIPWPGDAVRHSDAPDTHHRAATVALLSRLHEAISAHGRVQQLWSNQNLNQFELAEAQLSVSEGGTHLHRLVKETGSSTAVQEVMKLLHVTVGELLGEVVAVNAESRSDKSSRKNTLAAGKTLEMQLLQLFIMTLHVVLMAHLIKLYFLSEKMGVSQVLSECHCTYSSEEILT